MKRMHSIVLLFVLVIAPMFPVFMVPITNTDSINSLDDIPVELVDVGAPDSLPKEDVDLNMMFFTETTSSDEGLYYVCRRGMDSIAYFGESMVKYLSGGTVFTLEFPGSRSVVPQGESPTGSVTNYLLGNDPSKWRTGIEDCGVLSYSEIYPGIDLVYKLLDGNLKYEFVVKPYANPELIQMRYPEADLLDVHDDHLTVSKSEFSFSDIGLWVFQGGEKIVEVDCAFQPLDMNMIGFDVGHYIKSQTLIIDPTLVYSTYLGGSSDDRGYGIAVEGGSYDCFVTKFAADGKSLLYSTFLGGTSDDYAMDIAVESGYAYITGYSSSSGFPTVNAYDSTHGGLIDCFVSKLAADGQSLIYSTYLGDSLLDMGDSIAVEDGYAYVTGSTGSTGFPTYNAYDSTHNGGTDCFVTKFAADGQSLNYS
ncbi:MAG: DUF7948 domain-containing protein, partial [Candidatus Thorarchaeota archaeon]